MKLTILTRSLMPQLDNLVLDENRLQRLTN
jgi:hypothetical protein